MKALKNNKKGFTLVELVVVIAILAILAAIAIPVVSNTINSSKVSGAASDAQTIELALKEANAQIEAGDTSVYSNGAETTVEDVFAEKGLSVESYIEAGGNKPKAEVVVNGKTYKLSWCKNKNSCKYIDYDNNTDIQLNEVDSNEYDEMITPGELITELFLKE